MTKLKSKIIKVENFLEKYDNVFTKLGADAPEYKLTKADIITIHDKSIERYGGLLGVRDEDLLESSTVTPYQSAFGTDMYPTIFDKAAKYLFEFAHYQIFNDGNKRTGLAVMGYFLAANGFEFNMSDVDTYEFVMDIANNKYTEINEIADVIKANTIIANDKTANFSKNPIIYITDNNTITENEDYHER